MHVHVNAAMSADGKLSTRERRQVEISGATDFARVDRLRGRVDAVMLGVGTVVADDPSLQRFDAETRASTHGADAAPPARVVVDTRLRTPTDARILAGDPRTYILHGSTAGADRRGALEAAGATLVEAGSERVDLADGLERLDGLGIDRLLVEGGGEIIYSLFDRRLVDRLTVFLGPMVIGGRQAPTLADGDGFLEAFPRLSLEDVSRLDEGVLLEWQVTQDESA